MQEGSLFSTLSSAFIVCRFFDNGHSDPCEVTPYCWIMRLFMTLYFLQLYEFYKNMQKCLEILGNLTIKIVWNSMKCINSQLPRTHTHIIKNKKSGNKSIWNKGRIIHKNLSFSYEDCRMLFLSAAAAEWSVGVYNRIKRCDFEMKGESNGDWN